MQILETRSEVKIKVTRKWYATLGHPKMHPHTKCGIPATSTNIGDMHRTRSETDGLTNRQCDYYITICLSKFLWELNKIIRPTYTCITLRPNTQLLSNRQQFLSYFLSYFLVLYCLQYYDTLGELLRKTFA